MDIAKICRRVALKLRFCQSFRRGIVNTNSVQWGSVVVTTTNIEQSKSRALPALFPLAAPLAPDL